MAKGGCRGLEKRDVLPDLLAPGLKVVFCGPAVGHRSAAQKAYYAGSGNKFWATLLMVGLTPRRLAPAEYPELLNYGIGLTDVVKGKAGLDIEWTPGDADPTGLRSRLGKWQPRWLAFNGKAAAQIVLGKRQVLYGEQQERIGLIRLFVLPSTSGAANGYWDLTQWREFAREALGSDSGLS